MEVVFLGQPFSEGKRLDVLLLEALRDADAFHVTTAWAQVSGLGRLAEEIRELRDRGGSASIVLGLDGGIATRESLELAMDLFDPALAFHDTGDRLFHPKLYCVESSEAITVAVGSSNLTGGGLFQNYEANVVLRLCTDAEEDMALYHDVCKFRSELLAGAMPVRELDQELIDVAERLHLVTTEDVRERARRTLDAEADSLLRAVFGPPVSGLPGVPPGGKGLGGSKQSGRPFQLPGSVGASGARPIERWWKQLTASDALKKPDGSHQRNSVILGDAGRGVEFKTWFRNVLFGEANWTTEIMRSGNPKEVAVVPFEVLIEDEAAGIYELLIDHSDVRIANQNNAPTYLNWSRMTELIREAHFKDWWLELSSLSDGSYRLRLLREEPVLG